MRLECGEMDVSQAIEQLEEIRGHLSRTEVYRGYRSRTLVLTAAIGLLGSVAISWNEALASDLARVGVWVAVAALNLAIVTWEVLGDYGNHKTEHQRQVTKRTLYQFLPSIATGAMITPVLAQHPTAIEFLPGIWSCLFAMGIFASRPYLPHGVGWVGAYHMVTAASLLALPEVALTNQWAMGVTFACGQLFMAYVLYKNLERTNCEP